jgi:AcrR family transcriptional regulator
MTSKGDIKFDQIVDTGRALFWRHGIRRITVEEICKKAGVSKMTFYKHFPNKHALARFIFEQITDQAIGQYRVIMKRKIPFSKKAAAAIQLKMEQSDQMSHEFYNDIMRTENGAFKELIDHRIRESLEMFRQDFEKAQARGEIRQDLNTEFIPYFLNHLIGMAKDPNLSRFYTTPQQMIMELTNFFFYGIMPREKEDQSKD